MIPIRGLRSPVAPPPPPKPARRRAAEPKKAIDWTPEREAQLEAMWRAGDPASQIAVALGTPGARNSVIGKARRLRLPSRAIPVAQARGGRHG